MYITVSELKANLEKYLNLVQEEGIYVSKNGNIVAKISDPFANRGAAMKSLFGIFPSDVSLDDIQSERRSLKYNI